MLKYTIQFYKKMSFILFNIKMYNAVERLRLTLPICLNLTPVSICLSLGLRTYLSLPLFKLIVFSTLIQYFLLGILLS